MTDPGIEHADDEVMRVDISDEALEAAAGADRLRGYTELAYCTAFACPL
jgi:hypothetical protein